MGIRFRCRICNRKYELDESLAGRKARCIACKERLVIPTTSELPPRIKTSFETSGSVSRSVAVPVADLLELNVQKVKSIRDGSRKANIRDIVFRCKLCNQKYRLPRPMAGKIAECAKCRRNIVIPEHSEFHAAPHEESIAAMPPATKLPDQAESEITFWCKLCRQKYRLANALAGHVVKCVRCRQAISIPLQSEAAPPPKRKVPETIPATPSDPALQLVFRCKSCNIKYRLSKELAGALVSCTRCQTMFEVPSGSEPETTETTRSAEISTMRQMRPEEVESRQIDHIMAAANNETVIESLAPTEFEGGKTTTLDDASTSINSFVKYVLEIPERNFLVGMLHGIGCFFSDWLRRYKVFQKVSKNSLLIGAGIIVLLLTVYTFGLFTTGKPSNAPVKCEIHSMCESCGNRIVKSTVDLRNEKCARCSGAVGAAWKCNSCDKYFPFFEHRAPRPKSREELTGDLIKCPFCKSSDVDYDPGI